MKKRKILAALGSAAGAVGAAVAFKMLTRAKAVVWDDVSQHVPHHERSRFTQVDGARVHYQEFGDPTGPVLLLIHGYTASVFVWKSAAPMLGQNGFRVIALDLLGFGYSEKPAWFDYEIGSQARIAARFMNRLGVGRATVIGSSYGGAVAATIALDYPERVEKLVLVGTVCNDVLRNLPVMRLAAIPLVGEAITPFLADSRIFQRRRMRKVLAPANHELITRERVEGVIRPLAAADAHHSLLATSRAWKAERISEDAHLISQPTLIVWGEDDQLTPVEDGRRLHDSILHSRLVVLKDCGHVPQEEKSELFTKIVSNFCRDPRAVPFAERAS